METRHLAGLERLDRPSCEGKVVSCRVLVELVVPAARRRLVLDDAVEALLRRFLAVRVLRHAIRLAECVGADEEAVFVAVRRAEMRLVVRTRANVADQVVDRHLHCRAKVALVGRRAPGILAVRKIGENCKRSVRDSVPPLAPAAVGVLVRLEPPENLHDSRFGGGIAVSSAASRRRADRAGRPRAGHGLHGDRRLDDGDRIHRSGFYGNLRRRRRRHRRHVRDGVGIGRVDGDLDLFHRRGLDVVGRDFLLFLQLLGLFLYLGDVDDYGVLLLARYHRDDAQHHAEDDRNDDCRERGGEALELDSCKLVVARVMGLAEALEHVAETLEETPLLVLLRDFVKVDSLAKFLFYYFFAHFSPRSSANDAFTL